MENDNAYCPFCGSTNYEIVVSDIGCIPDRVVCKSCYGTGPRNLWFNRFKPKFVSEVETGNGASELDELCPYREHYHNALNKGTFTPGRGYTQYYKEPIQVCNYRMHHGCPESCKCDMNKLINDFEKDFRELKMSDKVRKHVRFLLKCVKLYIANDRGANGSWKEK